MPPKIRRDTFERRPHSETTDEHKQLRSSFVPWLLLVSRNNPECISSPGLEAFWISPWKCPTIAWLFIERHKAISVHQQSPEPWQTMEKIQSKSSLMTQWVYCCDLQESGWLKGIDPLHDGNVDRTDLSSLPYLWFQLFSFKMGKSTSDPEGTATENLP